MKYKKIELQKFSHYPSIIRRILIDKPEGWEYRLTAELMRYYNKPLFRKLDDLNDGLYTQNQNFISEEKIIDWVSLRLIEFTKLSTPFAHLLERLNKSFGLPGKNGDVNEIQHITYLIKENIEQIISFEEKIHSVNFPEQHNKLISLFKNTIGSQVKKLSSIPESIDKMLLLADTEHGGTTENPKLIKEITSFELPNDWQKQFDKEIKKVFQNQQEKNNPSTGCLSLFLYSFYLFFYYK